MSDIERFNTLLDSLTERLFVSPGVFVQTMRAACDIHGINLPLLPIEGTNGVTPEEGPSILHGATLAVKPEMYSAPDEAEYVFNVTDADGNIEDFYLYLIVEKTDTGYYHCYAQLVDDDELRSVLVMPEPKYDAEQERDYLTMTRHAKGTNPATTTDMDDGPPLD